MDTQIPTASREAFKTAGRLLMAHLRANGFPGVDHPYSLDALSVAHGIKDWNVMSALLGQMDTASMTAVMASAPPTAVVVATPHLIEKAVLPLFGDEVTEHNWFDFLVWAHNQRPVRISIVTVTSGRQVMGKLDDEWHPVSRHPVSNACIEAILRMTYGDNAIGTIQSTSLDYMMEPNSKCDGATNSSVLRVRYGASCSNAGYVLTARIMPVLPFELSMLGVEEPIISAFKPIQGGLNMFAGMAGSGKNALMASLVHDMCFKESNHEMVYDLTTDYNWRQANFITSQVVQVEMGIDASSRVGNMVRAMRNQATVILAGNLRNSSNDEPTLSTMVEAAMSGSLVVGGMAVQDIPTMCARMVGFCSSDGMVHDLISSLNLLVAQGIFKRHDGTRCAVREWLVMDGIAKEFMRHSFKKEGAAGVEVATRELLMRRKIR